LMGEMVGAPAWEGAVAASCEAQPPAGKGKQAFPLRSAS
jgi:hypothetical protein